MTYNTVTILVISSEHWKTETQFLIYSTPFVLPELQITLDAFASSVYLAPMF
jgi:hypothetical protein